MWIQQITLQQQQQQQKKTQNSWKKNIWQNGEGNCCQRACHKEKENLGRRTKL